MKQMEQLETRRLLSVVLKSNGILQINATSGNDIIRVGFDDTFINLVAATLNGKQKLYQPRDIRKINIESLTGHDRIVIESSLTGLGAINLNMNTGKGDDRVTIKAVKNVKINVDLGDGKDLLTSDGAVVVKGGAGDDSITIAAGEAYAGRGNDFLEGAGWLFGGDGNDLIHIKNIRGAPTGVSSTVRGGNGNDTIQAFVENVYLVGEAGDDLFIMKRIEGLDRFRGSIRGDDGNDVVEARPDDFSMANMRVYGGAGDDRLVGREVYGDEGNDLIQGTPTSDWLFGGDGNDTLYGGGASDLLDGGNGNDHFYGGWRTAPSTSLTPQQRNVGHDTVVAGEGIDFLDDQHQWADTDADPDSVHVPAFWGMTFSNPSFLPPNTTYSGVSTGPPSVPAVPAIAYIDDSLLLAGSHVQQTNAGQSAPPELTTKQLKKIKPGLISIPSNWDASRVRIVGNVQWLKVNRNETSNGDSLIRLELNVPILKPDGTPIRTKFTYVATQTTLGTLNEVTFVTNFIAVHRDSVLIDGGATNNGTPTAPSFVNASHLNLLTDARLRVVRDWSNSYAVKDKAPLEPGVNPHGRRGIIVDKGIIWFDDVEHTYFEEIAL